MKHNKKVIIILLAIIIILGIIAASIILINYNNKIKSTETATLEEFSEEENTDDNNNEEIPVSADELENEEISNEIEANDENKATEKKDTNSNTTSNAGEYYIKVNIQANVVTIYKKDSAGNYTIPVKAMICSTGTATPKSGVYSTTNKYEWGALIGNVYGQYSTRIVGSILFHSVPYTQKNPATLEYWEYDKLGTTASAGCVRLTVADAKWIYDNCKSGTKVEFYSDSNPGPLGKPTAQKISNEDASVRCWDPTDPKSNNPWKTYNANKAESEVEEKNQNTNTQIQNEPKENNNVQNNVTQNNTVQNSVTQNNIVENTTIQNNTVKSNTVDTNVTQSNIIQNNIIENSIIKDNNISNEKEESNSVEKNSNI